MSRHNTGDNPNELQIGQEAAEWRFRQRSEIAQPAINDGLKGSEQAFNQLGDRLFTSTMRSPEQVLAEHGAYSNERFFLRTVRAGQETGRASATIQIQRDTYGIISNRMRIHDIIVQPLYRREGHGTTLLQEIELHAQRYSSTEIYGVFSNEGDESRNFYLRNGYHFRSRSGGGEEVYRALIDHKPALEYPDH